MLARFGEEALDLFDGVRLDLLLFDLGSLGNGPRVRGEVLATHGLVESGADRAVGLVGGAGGAAVVLHLLVEPLQMLGVELLQAVGAEAGNEVVVDRHPISVDRVLRDVRGSDVLDPVGEPRLHGPRLASLADGPLVALALQVADDLGDLGAGLAADVAPVRGAVVFDADGDVAVPTTVLAPEDRGGTVGLAGLGGKGLGHAAVPKSDAPSWRVRKSFTASAGMRRRLPILTEAISPAETYSYSLVRPMPRRRAASSTVSATSVASPSAGRRWATRVRRVPSGTSRSRGYLGERKIVSGRGEVLLWPGVGRRIPCWPVDRSGMGLCGADPGGG